MLYRMLKTMIEKGNTEGLAEKIDIFFAASKITQSQYEKLTELLRGMEKVKL